MLAYVSLPLIQVTVGVSECGYRVVDEFGVALVRQVHDLVHAGEAEACADDISNLIDQLTDCP